MSEEYRKEVKINVDVFNEFVQKRDVQTLTEIAILICFDKRFIAYRNYLLSTWNNEKARTIFDKIMFQFVMQVFEQHIFLKTSPEMRDHWKFFCMKNNAADWAQIYYDRKLDLKLKVYIDIEKRLHEVKNILFIQLGCSSGREIFHFANLFRNHEFIGIDSFQSVINFCNDKYNLSNLFFKKLLLENIDILMNECKKSIIIFSSGTMQYSQPEAICSILKKIKSYNAELFLLEPLSSEGRVNFNANINSTYRGNLAFNHRYKYLFNLLEFKEITSEIIVTDNEMVSEFYYHGTSN